MGANMIESKMGNYFEDFKKGQVIEHALSKTIFESDNNQFALMTMNHHPFSMDDEFLSFLTYFY